MVERDVRIRRRLIPQFERRGRDALVAVGARRPTRSAIRYCASLSRVHSSPTPASAGVASGPVNVSIFSSPMVSWRKRPVSRRGSLQPIVYHCGWRSLTGGALIVPVAFLPALCQEPSPASGAIARKTVPPRFSGAAYSLRARPPASDATLPYRLVKIRTRSREDTPDRRTSEKSTARVATVASSVASRGPSTATALPSWNTPHWGRSTSSRPTSATRGFAAGGAANAGPLPTGACPRDDATPRAQNPAAERPCGIVWDQQAE